MEKGGTSSQVTPSSRAPVPKKGSSAKRCAFPSKSPASAQKDATAEKVIEKVTVSLLNMKSKELKAYGKLVLFNAETGTGTNFYVS